jgi:hypothetical protein
MNKFIYDLETKINKKPSKYIMGLFILVVKYWKSSKDSPKTELAYITEAEKGLLLDANLHGSLKNGQPNVGASGLLSYDGWGDASDGFGGGNGGGGDARESYGAGGQYQQTTTPSAPSVSVGGGDKYTDRIVRIAQGTEPGYTPTSSQPFGLSPEQAYQEGKITADQYQQVQQAQDSLAVDNRSTLQKVLIL